MKLYAINYNYNTPASKQIMVPTNSQFKIGVKAVRNGLPVEINPATAVLKSYTNEIAADAELYNGYVTFSISIADNASIVKYGLDVEGDLLPDFYLTINAVNSTECDINDGGELPADLSCETLTVKNTGYTLLSAAQGTETDSCTLLVNGTDAKVRIGTPQTTGSIRINSNGTTPSIEGGKGRGQEAAYSLSCDRTGMGILTLNTVSIDSVELSSLKSLSGNLYDYVDSQIGNVLTTDF